ncbi:MAG: cyclic pyranopterin monophosphate synthase MoaC [Gammaproteobacteria bacterium]|nr:cyclic pyranopterin monophosphate synthase MoaC [Gammaproteobacteria bacterium]
MAKLTHFSASGEAHMVDVGDKQETRRIAEACGYITMQVETLSLIIEGNHKKGDVLGVARIAGIMAVKKTSELVPLCHSILIDSAVVSFETDEEKNRVSCVATVQTVGKTGVEMEALMAVQIALLTIYDMCKSVDRGMAMGGIRLLRKEGGKSGTWSSTF